MVRSFFLPLDTDGLSSSSGGLGVLSSDLESPLVPETSVASDFEESLDVLSQLGLQDVGGHLKVLSLLVIPLPVEEPSGHAVSFGVVDEIGDGVALSLSEFSGSKFGVESEDLADEETESPANSLNLVERKRYSPFTVDVGVEDTMNVLEGVLSVFDDERH